ncbi:MAG: Fic family protein [Pseudobdellovibrionaceae bacterium]
MTLHKRKKKKKKLTEASYFGEIQFSSSSKKEYLRRMAAVKQGYLRQVAPKIYTTNFEETDAAIVRRNWKEILGHLFPGAIVSHRTAQEMRPSKEGFIHLTYRYTKRREFPGLTVFLTKGPEKQSDDILLPGGLYLSSEPRKALENLQKASSKTHRTLSRTELEQWLDTLLNARGEKGLNALRDRARELLGLGWQSEMQKLDVIVSALLQTKSVRVLKSDVGKKRALGVPYDMGRIQLFDALFTALSTNVPKVERAPFFTFQQDQAFAFFESYFSNFIEGTEFEVSEAKEIVFQGKIPKTRSEDGHDILGVYALVHDKKDMRITPSNSKELIDILRSRHHRMMSGRLGVNPGNFKEKLNRAGETVFVAPDLVIGTLSKGFEFYAALRPGFARAAFMMFLVSEVHPFNDGNGRIARIMMNAELSFNNEPRVLIPIVYRTDYLSALRKLSRQRDPNVYIRMLQRAYNFSSQLKFSNIVDLEEELKASNAFKESEGNVLKLPSER